MLNWFLRNIRTLLLAFALALAVWISAVTSADPDETREFPRAIPLEIVGQDPGLVITGSLPGLVRVTLRAPQSVWDELLVGEKQVRAVIDLSGLGAGEHSLPVQVQVAPRPVRIVSTVPGNLNLVLEQQETRALPVELKVNGQPAIGFQAEDALVEPIEAVISGPTSLVQKAASIQVEVNINGARASLEGEIPLRVLDANGQALAGLTLLPEKALVEVPVTQQGGYRDIAVKVVVRGQVASGYRLTNITVFPPALTVFSGDPSLVASLPGFVETEPLNLNGASQNIETRLGLNLPQGISVVGDQTVLVQVGISSIEGSLTLNNMPVQVLGLAPGLNAQIAPETVDVILTGPLPLLDKLTQGDVTIVVDLTGLDAGTHQVIATAEILIGDIKIQSINPTAIEVVITNTLPIPSPTVNP
jgi:YbbR domain-containing protein